MAKHTAKWIALFILFQSAAFAATDTPYAGQEKRDLASLSEGDVEDLLAGNGWGHALPAELNGYPGPLHVLELSEELELTDQQLAKVTEVFNAMRAEARDLGTDYVNAERHISKIFRSGHANDALLSKLLDDSAAALSKLRATHLRAHLAVTPILTDDQKKTYAQLRGYAENGAHSDHSGHGNH